MAGGRGGGNEGESGHGITASSQISTAGHPEGTLKNKSKGEYQHK